MNESFRLPPLFRRVLARWLARPRSPATRPTARHTCIYKVDRLGDFVLALGALHNLVDHHGAAECRLIVSTAADPVAAAEFPDVPRWVIPASTSGVWRELRPLRMRVVEQWGMERFAELVCLRHAQNLHRDASLGWVHAAAWRGLGARPTSDTLAICNRPVLANEYPAAAALPWSRELLAHQLVIEQTTGKVAGWSDLRPTLRSVRATDGAAWVFCPFGGEDIRDYPEAHWISAWSTAALPPGPVQLLGPRGRIADLNRLAARLGAEAGRGDVTVATDLPTMEFIRRIAAARGVVTVESAAAHLATALDKPAVIIIGGGHFGWFAPWGDGKRQRWVANELDCFGCNWICRYPTVRCLADLPAAVVGTALQTLNAHA